MALLDTSSANADPTGLLPPKPVEQLPAHLQKYIPRSAAWVNSPWMTSPTCQDKGGDFSVWAQNVITDAADLMQFFDPGVSGDYRNEVLNGYRALPDEIGTSIPTGYCINDMKRWAGTDPAMVPFDFPWGLHHQSMYRCTWAEDTNEPSNKYYNAWVGAERAPCNGFFVRCEKAVGAEKDRCDLWNSFSDDFVDRVENIHHDASQKYPATGQGEIDIEIKSPGEIVGDVALGWFEDLTRAIAEGAATLLGEAMSFWTRTDRSAMLQSPAIGEIQAMLWYVGVVLLAGSVAWQGIIMLYKRKPDPLVSTGMGLLSFVGWSTLGTSAAVLLYEGGNALANQVLDESINKFSTTMGAAMQANLASAAVVFFLAIILFFLACIQWILGFFRMGALVILLALIPTAAAGQINEATKPWLRKILSWSLSLILYQPIAAVIFAIGFVLVGNGTDIGTILTGMAVLCLAVMSMPTMLRFFDWGGQRFTSAGGGGGGAMAAGAAASVIGGGGAIGFSRFMDQSGPAGRGGSETSSGALPVSSAHTGDGPGGGRAEPTDTGPTGGLQGGRAAPRPPGTDVVSAVAGANGGAASGAAPSSGGGVSAAGGGPGGAPVAAAQAAKDDVGGAMTGGSPDVGGSRDG